MKNLTEMAFDWLPKNYLETGNLLKLIAKTTEATIHPEDPNYPVRKFSTEELKRAARTLVGRPVGRNHEDNPIFGAYVVYSEFNDNRVESVAYAPTEWVDKVKSGMVKNCSIEYTWRDEKKVEGGGVEFGGLVFTRVDLLEGLNPGDPNAKVMLFEASKKTGALLNEVTLVEFGDASFPDECFAYVPDEAKGDKGNKSLRKLPYKNKDGSISLDHVRNALARLDQTEGIPADKKTDIRTMLQNILEKENPEYAKKLGEPFAGYTDFASCVAANQDKANPEAYCGAIKAQTEAQLKESKELEEAQNKLKETEEAFKRVGAELATLKTNQEKAINEAKESVRKELVEKITAKLPNLIRPDARTRRLIHDIREVL